MRSRPTRNLANIIIFNYRQDWSYLYYTCSVSRTLRGTVPDQSHQPHTGVITPAKLHFYLYESSCLQGGVAGTHHASAAEFYQCGCTHNKTAPAAHQSRPLQIGKQFISGGSKTLKAHSNSLNEKSYISKNTLQILLHTLESPPAQLCLLGAGDRTVTANCSDGTLVKVKT